MIVTLAIDPASQRRFDDLRREHFPRERNHLTAHVTLFHALPGDQLPTLRDDLASMAAREPFAVAVTGLRLLGGGVAYALASPELQRIHETLARRWAAMLTRQDSQSLRPHVTVQNKVSAETARRTYAQLEAAGLPPAVSAQGLALWRYLGGPWETIETMSFRSGQSRPVHRSADE